MSNMDLFSWYPFKNSDVIWDVDLSSADQIDETIKYDYILVKYILEEKEYDELKKWFSLFDRVLKEGGKILLVEENRNAAHRLAGGLKESINGLTKEEIVYRINGIGEYKIKFYYSLASGYSPQCIYTDDRLPTLMFNERYVVENIDICGLYRDERDIIYDAIKQNCFPFVSNGFFIEITRDVGLSNILTVAINLNRCKENVFSTIIFNDGRVLKHPVYSTGQEVARRIWKNACELANRGIPILPMQLEDDGLWMDYVEAPTVQDYLRKLVSEKEKEQILEVFDLLWNHILKSSDYVSSSYKGFPILKKGFIEMIPLNSFWFGNDMIFFDQEFTYDDCLSVFILIRAIIYAYEYIPEVENIISLEKMYERYKITNEIISGFKRWESTFLDSINNNSSNITTWNSKDYLLIETNKNRLIKLGNKEEPYYKVGFVPGVFDMFHTGHINLLRKCKAHCGYLIAGVLIDELVHDFKGKYPLISVEDRAKVLEACKYVDEVVIIDYHNVDKLRAWELYHYDCHFSGNDHEEEWIELKKKLNELGSDMMFFKYTEGVSSTQIREKYINKDT